MRYEMKAETESQKCYGINFRKLMEAMKSIRLTAADMEMLFALLCYLQKDNLVSIHQQDIADELGIQRSSVTRSITHLVKAGLFVREGRALYASRDCFIYCN